MKTQTSWMIVGLCACLLAGGVLGGGDGIAAAAWDDVELRVGQPPPEFSAQDLTNHAQTLQQYRGKVLVLHFWATWCPYCRGEIVELRALQEQWASKGVAVVTVSVDENRDRLKRFVERNALPYAVIFDGETDASVAARYRIVGVPTTYVIGRDGRIAFRFDGAGDLLEAVEHALARSGS